MFASKTRVVQDPKWNLWGRGVDMPTTTRVTATSSTQLLTVYGCVTRIADVIGTMPVDQYTKVGGVPRELSPRATWLDRPNVEQTWSTFIMQLVWSLLIDGNGFIVPVRSDRGRVNELWIIDPTIVDLHRLALGAPISVHIGGQPYSGELVHLAAYLRPGEVRGINPIENARIALGLGMAAQEFGKGFFDNSALPSVVVKVAGEVTSKQMDEVRTAWQMNHRGPGRSSGVGVLGGGADVQQLTIAPEQAQFLESRRFSAAEIAANLFHVPPDMVGVALEGSSVTYQNMETRWTEFIRSACQRWMTSIESAFSEHFLPRPQYIKFVPDVYLRADTKTRYETHKIGIDGGFLLDDEARRLEDLPPLTDEQRAQVGGARKLTAAEAVQKVYLGVGKVITSDEARELVNEAGGNLDLPGPEFPTSSPSGEV